MGIEPDLSDSVRIRCRSAETAQRVLKEVDHGSDFGILGFGAGRTDIFQCDRPVAVRQSLAVRDAIAPPNRDVVQERLTRRRAET